MEYVKKNILENVNSWHFPIFCGSMLFSHYFGTKLLNYYKGKRQMNMHVESTRYFIMHFLFNMCSTVYTYRNMIETLANPLVIKNESNIISFYNVLFHLYHTAFYWKSIELDEKIHHGLMVFLLCPLTWMNYTNLCNMAQFYMIGLPGGIVYLLLSLKNLGLIDSLTEKRISKYVGLYIRAPGCCALSYIVFLNYINNNFGKPSLATNVAALITIFGGLWNGMHFASTITESYGIHKVLRTKAIA